MEKTNANSQPAALAATCSPASFRMTGLMEITPAVALLATVAAPYAAAGKPPDEALACAYRLIDRTNEFMFQKSMEDLRSRRAHSLKSIRATVGSKKTVKSYVFGLWPCEVAETLWTLANAGERCFTVEHVKQMKEERARRFAKGRSAKAGKSGF